MTDLLTDVIGAHRVIRQVPAEDGAFAGSLVTDGPRTAVATTVAELADRDLWRWAGCEHIAAPRDLALGEEGALALMPWCQERVVAMLARRTPADALGSGEAVTLVVSMLRGLVEMEEDPAQVRGHWWLTDEGRPMLVIGDGSTVAEETRRVLLQVTDDVRDRRLTRVLRALGEALERPRAVVREVLRWESELLECASPRPVRTDVYPPATARSITAASVVPDEERRASRMPRHDRVARTEELMTRLDAVRTQVRERLRTLARRRNRSVEAEARSAPRSRKPLAVGAVAAALVIGGGALWPATAVESDDPPPETSSIAPSHPLSDPIPAEGDQPGVAELPLDTAESDAGPLDSLPGLFAAAIACAAASEDDCSSAIAHGSSLVPEVLAAHATPSREADLVDDYGDVAVVRLPDTETDNEVILVLARVNDIWLFRDLYDVAKQPE